MTQLAVAHPSIGVVSAYGLVRKNCTDLLRAPCGSECVQRRRSAARPDPGRGASVRVAHQPAVPGRSGPRTTAAVLSRGPLLLRPERLLRAAPESDFGFVHQVLAFARKQPDSTMVNTFQLQGDALMAYVIAHEYGPEVLDPAELADRMAELTDATSVPHPRSRLDRREGPPQAERGAVGVPASASSRPSEPRSTPACSPRGVLRALAESAANPGTAVTKLRKRFRGTG